MNKYTEAYRLVAAEAHITVCYRCNCRTGSYDLGHSRAHAHVKERKTCLVREPKTRSSLFTFLHEVGHIVADKANYSSGVPRALAEWNATVWGMNRMKQLGIPVPRKEVAAYKVYVNDKIARGLRRGLRVVPAAIRNL